ncbi:hypothetical protein [Curtobacterium sp. MCBD17_021]|uniref:hypothetical protein n=1 Tax=Curtobacterium sp. MCBD17_021 TaxID=2175665 RepID=UPI000DA98EFF|nr:hypothetical protein [Curtobacterium sp. MCBD17_021]PZE63526.1 hypothetical protein DEI83_14275 [Curtobacterium sp. MCBD17_021]
MTRTTTTKTTATLGALAVLLLTPGLLAGCSGNRDDGPGPGTGTSRSAAHAGAGELGDCLRKKGYDVSDDELGVGGGTSAELSLPGGVDEQQWLEDTAACSGTSTSAGQVSEAKSPPGYEEADRKASECIREQGFADYPDDDDDRSAYHPADESAFERVAEQCEDEAFAGLGDEASSSGGDR